MVLFLYYTGPDGGVSASAGSSQFSDSQGGSYGTTYTSGTQTPGGPYQEQHSAFYGPGFGYNSQQHSTSSGVPQQTQFQQPFVGLQPFAGMQPFQSQFGGFPTGFPHIPFVPAIPFKPLQFAPLPPLLSPPQFNEALNQYVTSLQQQYAK